jgi:aminomethyltransferase
MSASSHRTPLYEAHQKLGARIVDFHGWEMPIQYQGIIPEHTAVRTRAGLFDLSHMGRVRVRGSERVAFLQKVLTIDVGRVVPGKCRYTFLLNERGTILDDLILYRDRDEDLLVVNASNREKDLKWLQEHLPSGVTLEDETFQVALLAVQGPRALETLKRVLELDPGSLGYYTFGRFGSFLISRTGYTGEDGFEIFLEAKTALAVWDRFVEKGITPVGLGARDTLRTEAAMPLYGNDIDETTTPLEAGLAFAVDLKKSEFIGQEALRQAGAPARQLSGLVLETKRSPRPGYAVWRGGQSVSAVTSGTFSPTLDKSIALAYLPREARAPGEAYEVDVRGRREPAVTVKLPFFRREKT